MQTWGWGIVLVAGAGKLNLRLALERRREDRQQAPPVAVTLPAHVQARDIAVRPHSLDTYDTLKDHNHEES
jgi:hypothetical protein